MLDLKGTPIVIGSKKNCPLHEIIDLCTRQGSVIIVGTDKHKIPSQVAQFGVKVGALPFSPKEDISVTEKVNLTKKYHPKDSHKRDALASAIIAYNKFSPLLTKAMVFCEKQGIRKTGEFIRYLLTHPTMNLSAVREHMEEIPKKVNIPQKSSIQVEKKLVSPEISRLNKENELLRAQNLHLSSLISPVKKEKKTDNEKQLLEIIQHKERRFMRMYNEYQQVQKSLHNCKKDILQLIHLAKNIPGITIVPKYPFPPKIKECKDKWIFVENIKPDDPNIGDTYLKEGITLITTQKLKGTLQKSSLTILYENSAYLLIKNPKPLKQDILGKVVEEYKNERYTQ